MRGCHAEARGSCRSSPESETRPRQWPSPEECPTAVQCRAVHEPARRRAPLAARAEAMGKLTEPCCATWRESSPTFPREPRGTPRPAESLRTTNPCGVSVETARGGPVDSHEMWTPGGWSRRLRHPEAMPGLDQPGLDQPGRVYQPYPKPAWPPSPAVSWTVFPIPGMEGYPTPGIGRYPRVARGRVPSPGTIHVGIPACTRKERSPQRAAIGSIDKAPVIVQVGNTVGIGRLSIGSALGIALVIVNRLLIPNIIFVLRHVFG